MPRGAFLRIVRRDPEAGFAITKQVAGRLARIEARLEDLAFRSVDARVVRTLLYLAEEFGRPAGDWTEVDVALTQAELATLVGTTRQSVSECMRSLAKSGCIMRDRGRLALKLSKLRKHVAPRLKGDVTCDTAAASLLGRGV